MLSVAGHPRGPLTVREPSSTHLPLTCPLVGSCLRLCIRWHRQFDCSHGCTTILCSIIPNKGPMCSSWRIAKECTNEGMGACRLYMYKILQIKLGLSSVDAVLGKCRTKVVQCQYSPALVLVSSPGVLALNKVSDGSGGLTFAAAELPP